MGTVLIVPDLHLPFEHKKALTFISDISRKYKPDHFVQIGDLVDHHSINMHDHNHDGMSSGAEIGMVQKKLKKWFELTDRLLVCIGNHDALPERRARKHGLSQIYFRNYHELFGLPPHWEVAQSFDIDGVHYTHKTTKTGINGHRLSALSRRQSIVMGHTHTHAGVSWLASKNDLIFGMNVGCLIDIHAYAMQYATDSADRPILGCGIVKDGKFAKFLPMDLTLKRYRR